MVTVYIGGGLANKMFQYAFSLAIKKMGYDIAYDTYSFKTEFIHDQVSLSDIFTNVNLKETSDYYFAAGKNCKLHRLWKIISPSYIIERAYLYNSEITKQLRNNCYVESSWQDERYFIEAAEDVRNAYRFPVLENEKNLEIAKQMSDSNSVAIHIRKGDGYGIWNIFKNTCPKEYYASAIAYIKEHVLNPRFFIFTDSPETVNNYLEINNYTLINWNPSLGKQNYIDMQLMSLAKHNIIANSTYSWWGAWLNSNHEKIVVGPKYWYNPDCELGGINHIIPDKWVKL